MRPIGTPNHTVWRGFNDRLGEGDHVQIGQASLDVGLGDRTDLVEAAQLPEAVILQQVEKKPEGRLVETVLTRTRAMWSMMVTAGSVRMNRSCSMKSGGST